MQLQKWFLQPYECLPSAAIVIVSILVFAVAVLLAVAALLDVILITNASTASAVPVRLAQPGAKLVDYQRLIQLTVGHYETGAPTRCATTNWKCDLIGIDVAAGEEPGDHGVGVPHVASVEFVSSPHRYWDRRQEFEQALRTCGIGADRRGGHSRVEIRDGASAPSADLIAENAEAAEPLQPYWSFCHNPPCFSMVIGDRGHFDGVSAFGNGDDESGMVDVAGWSPLQQGRNGFERLATEFHHPLPGAKRDP